MSYAELAAQVAKAAEELIALAQVRAGQVLVVGCSTSEVLGSKIGTAGSEEPALAMFKSLQAVAAKHELFLAIQ